MNEHDVFVADCPVPVIRAVIEAELGTAFHPGPGPDHLPCLITGTTKVFFHGSHPFDHDTDFPVSRYAYWINVHDSARNHEGQLAVARRIFDAARARNWPAMLSYGTQGPHRHLPLTPGPGRGPSRHRLPAPAFWPVLVRTVRPRRPSAWQLADVVPSRREASGTAFGWG